MLKIGFDNSLLLSVLFLFLMLFVLCGLITFARLFAFVIARLFAFVTAKLCL